MPNVGHQINEMTSEFESSLKNWTEMATTIERPILQAKTGCVDNVY